MKVLFINALFKADYSALDIGITLLATIINQTKRHQAFIADTTFHFKDWKDYLAKKIKKVKPDMFAFSCNNLYMNYVNKISAFLKKNWSGVPIIGGGFYTTIYSEEAIQNKYLDAILLGDGDEKIVKILDYYQRFKKFPKNIKGFWIKEKIKKKNGYDIKIVRTGKGDFTKNLDNLPFPDWDLWEDLDKYFYYLQMLYFVGSRGCPYSCTFCETCEMNNYVDGSYFRQINPKRFAEELAYQWKKYKKRGMRLAQIFDPVFTINKKWLEKFKEEYSKLLDPEKHPISVFSRIDNLDEEKIIILKESGCRIIRLGIESGDDYIRNKILNKKLSTKKILKINRLLKKYKLVVTYYYMLGAPGETRKTINRTIKLANYLDASRSAFFVFKPLTKKSLEIIKELNIKIDENKYSVTDNLQYGAVLKLKDISPWQVELLQKKAYIQYLMKKIPRLIKKNKLNYFINFYKYVSRGLKDGLSLSYLVPYYHIYGYDNLLE